MWALLYYILDLSPENVPKPKQYRHNQENGAVLSKWELQMKTFRLDY